MSDTNMNKPTSDQTKGRPVIDKGQQKKPPQPQSGSDSGRPVFSQKPHKQPIGPQQASHTKGNDSRQAHQDTD